MQEHAKGIIRKMSARLEDTVAYSLRLGDHLVPANELVEKQVRLEFTGAIFASTAAVNRVRVLIRASASRVFKSSPPATPASFTQSVVISIKARAANLRGASSFVCRIILCISPILLVSKLG